MGKIQVETCHIEGLKVIPPQVFGDQRGYFMETWQQKDFESAGIDVPFVQDNQSGSKRGVLRGLHYQINYPQDKLVRVVNGAVYDENGFPLNKDNNSGGMLSENKDDFALVLQAKDKTLYLVHISGEFKDCTVQVTNFDNIICNSCWYSHNKSFSS